MTKQVPKERRYQSSLRRGWVVRSTARVKRKDGREGILTSWWYGPRHGFSTTWGPLDYSVAVFATKEAAQDAVARGYFGGSTGFAFETVSEARKIEEAAARRRTAIQS